MMDPRPEGVYCSWETDSDVPQWRGLLIERVNGDGSVSEFRCTDEENEAGAIREFLNRESQRD